ncbi:MAG: aspartyl/asparaginyl beta-hydroxylase domain-containing protein [Nitrospirota bacterium]
MMNQNFSSTPVVKDPPQSQSNALNQSHLQPAMTHKNGNEKKRSFLQQLRKRRRKWFKRGGKRILRALFRYLGKQSLVGDSPVFDTSKFPWAIELEKNFDVIHRELQGILVMREYIPLFHELSPDQKKISTGENWRTFFLKGFGYEAEQSWKRCPETMKILSNIPNLRSALFSILGPNYHIPHHRGVTKGLIRCHLGLIIPDQRDQCVMRVGDQICQWEEGRCFVFDDTYDHEVWNKTDQERVVLLIDVDRPMRLIGRLISQLLLFGIRRSGYVQDARKNLKTWESIYDQAESQQKVAAMSNPTS